MKEWWRGATIYQIYPRSFQDSDGDGVGDLPGITRRLPYVASLGVDAVWVSPFFKSPMRDFGYDVENYREVAPLFGTLEDADEMIQTAHRLGLRILFDMVLSHTSERHAWFQESRRSRTNAKADWYCWADAREDGTPPNNWLSIFGGVAWTWEPRREQYYLHNFLPSQPDLDLHNREVQDALLAECQFWLERGVDGFRLDAVNFLTHDRQLRDNPVRPAGAPPTEGVKPNNPYNRQLHVYDKSQPETLDFLRRLRELADHFPESLLVGEVTDDDSLSRIHEYAGPGGPLHTGYSFVLLGDELDLDLVRRSVDAFSGAGRQGWPAWAFSNHDVTRVVSRWGGPDAPPEFAQALILLLTSLRGTVFVYQGEELGLPEVDVPYEDIVDPYGLNFFPDFKGRDGARTPMPWTDADPMAGFTTAKPWLPIPNVHIARSVSAQHAEPHSTLNYVRRLLRWRRNQSALLRGSIDFLEVRPRQICLLRKSEEQAILVAVNLASESAEIAAPAGPLSPVEDLALGGRIEGDGEARRIVLPPHAGLICRVG